MGLAWLFLLLAGMDAFRNLGTCLAPLGIGEIALFYRLVVSNLFLKCIVEKSVRGKVALIPGEGSERDTASVLV